MVEDQATQRQIIQDNIEAIQFKINQAAQRGGRTLDQIQLVAVGKNHPVSSIQAAIEAGGEVTAPIQTEIRDLMKQTRNTFNRVMERLRSSLN